MARIEQIGEQVDTKRNAAEVIKHAEALLAFLYARTTYIQDGIKPHIIRLDRKEVATLAEIHTELHDAIGWAKGEIY